METIWQSPRRGTVTIFEEDARNIWCPEYDECLSKAARYDLPMYCRECPLNGVKMPVFVLTLCEIEGCKALVEKIFHPGKTDFF
jgi:hypothetical protein